MRLSVQSKVFQVHLCRDYLKKGEEKSMLIDYALEALKRDIITLSHKYHKMRNKTKPMQVMTTLA